MEPTGSSPAPPHLEQVDEALDSRFQDCQALLLFQPARTPCQHLHCPPTRSRESASHLYSAHMHREPRQKSRPQLSQPAQVERLPSVSDTGNTGTPKGQQEENLLPGTEAIYTKSLSQKTVRHTWPIPREIKHVHILVSCHIFTSYAPARE